jgi:prepilin-type N-terminal cleavage/methylation domain-containing protein
MYLAHHISNVQHRIHYKGGDNMISKIRRSMAGNEGFTLIELMIVVAIIGILAAVAVPNFLAYRDRSRQAAVIATGSGYRAAMAAIAADAVGNLYPADEPDTDALEEAGFKLPSTYETADYTSDGETYSVTITNNNKSACVRPNEVTKDPCS